MLVDQVEFADIILISKTDLISADELERLKAILKTLNTFAKLVPIEKGNVDISQVLNTGLFDFERAQRAPGWLKEMRGEHVPETEEYGIFTLCLQSDGDSFNPAKFFKLTSWYKRLWNID